MEIKSVKSNKISNKEDIYVVISENKEIEKLLYLKFYKLRNSITVELQNNVTKDIIRKIMLMEHIDKIVYVNSDNKKEEIINKSNVFGKFIKNAELDDLISDEAIIKFQQIKRRVGSAVEVDNITILTPEVLSVLERNNIKNIILSEENEVQYSIDKFKIIQKYINAYINLVKNEKESVEQFLELYYLLCDNIVQDTQNSNIGILNSIVSQKCPMTKYAYVLKYMLEFLNIKCKIIEGNVKYNGYHTWNQVRIDGIWYNVDLALDALEFQKNNVGYINKYCLKSDEDFYELHNPLTQSLEKCAKNSYYIVAKNIEQQENFVRSIRQKVLKFRRNRKKLSNLLLTEAQNNE